MEPKWKISVIGILFVFIVLSIIGCDPPPPPPPRCKGINLYMCRHLRPYRILILSSVLQGQMGNPG